jgi:hypothetical protein
MDVVLHHPPLSILACNGRDTSRCKLPDGLYASNSVPRSFSHENAVVKTTFDSMSGGS